MRKHVRHSGRHQCSVSLGARSNSGSSAATVACTQCSKQRANFPACARLASCTTSGTVRHPLPRWYTLSAAGCPVAPSQSVDGLRQSSLARYINCIWLICGFRWLVRGLLGRCRGQEQRLMTRSGSTRQQSYGCLVEFKCRSAHYTWIPHEFRDRRRNTFIYHRVGLFASAS